MWAKMPVSSLYNTKKKKWPFTSSNFEKLPNIVNPFNPKSDKYLISPYNKTAESFIKIVRIKEMNANLRSFDC